MEEMVRKREIILGTVFFGGIIIAAGFLLSPGAFMALPAAVNSQSSPQWTQAAGEGISVPACGSASNTSPTCVNGSPNVTISWDFAYDATHAAGPCSSASLEYRPQAWTVKTAGAANAGMAYGVISNRLYVAQGYPSLGGTGRYYDPGANTWTGISSAPVVQYWVASAVANGRLYSFSATAYEYNPSSDSWATLAPPPIDLSWGQAATVNGIIYVFSGTQNYAYDPSANSWTQKTSPPRDHGAWPAVAQVSDIIYVVGGATPYTNAVDAFNPVTNSWTQKADIPAPLGYKGYASAVEYNGKIYVLGGGSWGAGATDETWEYDPAANAWTRKPNMPTARNIPAAGVIGGKIYAYGGVTGAYLDENDEYRPVEDISIITINDLPCANTITIASAGGSENGGKAFASSDPRENGFAAAFTPFQEIFERILSVLPLAGIKGK